MSQLNLKQILSGDNLSIVVDKLNYNFDQIVLNGGGPQGLRGLLGSPGLPGLQGLHGETGPTGEKGTYIYADGATPGDYPFGTGGEALPRIGDIYIETDPTFLAVWELNATGSTGSYWNLVETISAPSSSWNVVDHQNGSGTDFKDIANDNMVAQKLFIGDDAAFATGPDGDARPYVFSDAFSNPTFNASLSLPADFSSSLAVISAASNQLRILSVGLSGATGGFGATAVSPANAITSRGGVVHSLEGRNVGGTIYQLYSIINGDSIGDKFFSLGLNSVRGNQLLFGDMRNRLGVGTPGFDVLGAQLNVVNSVAIGSTSSGFYNSPTLLNNEGLVVEGNLAVGLNNNSYANGVFFGATQSMVVIDSPSVAAAVDHQSVLSFTTNLTQPGSPSNYNAWSLIMHNRLLGSPQRYASLRLQGTSTGLTSGGPQVQYDTLSFSLTGNGSNVKPLVGLSNIDAISLFEIGDGANRTSVGGATGSGSAFDITNYLGFNLHRSPVQDRWYRRGDGANNGGRAIWSSVYSGFHFAMFGSTGGSTAGPFTDNDVTAASRLTIETSGAIRATETFTSAHIGGEFGPTGVGLYIAFGASGTTGSSTTVDTWRRLVGVFGKGPAAGNFGTPVIAVTNGLTQSSASSGNDSTPILPHYTFWNSDLNGLYLAQGTDANSTKFTPVDSSVGIAVGGTSAIETFGFGDQVRIGFFQRNPLDRLHIGDKLIYHDGTTKFIGHNAYVGSGGVRRIFGDSSVGSTGYGFVVIPFPEMSMRYTLGAFNAPVWYVNNVLADRYFNPGTKFAIEIGNWGGTQDTATSNDPFNPNYNIPQSGPFFGGTNRTYRAFILSPPLLGPTGTGNFAPYVPQAAIGVGLDKLDLNVGADSSTSAKRGTFVTASQLRVKDSNSIFFGNIEDIYTTGFYSHDGHPVAAISAMGGNSTSSPFSNLLGLSDRRRVMLSFLGNSGLATIPWGTGLTNSAGEDIPIFYASTNLSLNDTTSRSINFGSGFRVGIGATVSEAAGASSASLEVGMTGGVTIAANFTGKVYVAINDNTDPNVSNKPPALITESIRVNNPTRIIYHNIAMNSGVTITHGLGYIPQFSWTQQAGNVLLQVTNVTTNTISIYNYNPRGDFNNNSNGYLYLW